jgi:cell division protein FtsB
MQFFRIKRFEFVVSLGCIALLAYFGWQAERGARGFAYRDSLTAQVKKLSDDLETIKGQHKTLEARVAELRPDAIDPDLLDEMARKTLNFGNPSDLVVHFQN